MRYPSLYPSPRATDRRFMLSRSDAGNVQTFVFISSNAPRGHRFHARSIFLQKSLVRSRFVKKSSTSYLLVDISDRQK